MVKKAKPSKDLHEEANEYIEALPDETASGRLVTDSGERADATAWLAEHKRQFDAEHPKPL